MSNQAPDQGLSLIERMNIVLEAVLEIEKAKDETEACLVATLSLERLQYRLNMISFLRTIDGEQFVVADPDLATGRKWKAVAAATKRRFDPPTDLLPLVLKRRKARFILDSQNDPEGENDRELCIRLGIVTQYAMPLATDSMLIGTLQVDMGKRHEQPMQECMMLDALAAHLSIAVERQRALEKIDVLSSELMNQTKAAVYSATAATIMHELNRSIGDYATKLRNAVENPEIRVNKAAFEFLKFTDGCVGEWVDSLQEHISRPRQDEEKGFFAIEDMVKEAIDAWHWKAHARHCKLRGRYESDGAKAGLRRSSLKTVLGNLITNAIEANARNIEVQVRAVHATTGPGGAPRAIEIVVADDGHGIPPEFQAKMSDFGWTSKRKTGHGLGLTIIKMLCRDMDAKFALRSCGKSAGKALTELAITIPLADQQGDDKQ